MVSALSWTSLGLDLVVSCLGLGGLDYKSTTWCWRHGSVHFTSLPLLPPLWAKIAFFFWSKLFSCPPRTTSWPPLREPSVNPLWRCLLFRSLEFGIMVVVILFFFSFFSFFFFAARCAKTWTRRKKWEAMQWEPLVSHKVAHTLNHTLLYQPFYSTWVHKLNKKLFSEVTNKVRSISS